MTFSYAHFSVTGPRALSLLFRWSLNSSDRYPLRLLILLIQGKQLLLEKRCRRGNLVMTLHEKGLHFLKAEPFSYVFSYTQDVLLSVLVRVPEWTQETYSTVLSLIRAGRTAPLLHAKELISDLNLIVDDLAKV